MKQNEINRAVARVTGDTITTIRHLGFSLEELPEEVDEDSRCLDWDLFDNPLHHQRRKDSHAYV